MAPVTFLFGKTELKPSPTEGVVFTAGAAVLFYGMWTGKWKIAAGGALVASTVVYRLYEKANEVRDPDTMNGHFLTGGRASAMDSDVGAQQVRRILGI